MNVLLKKLIGGNNVRTDSVKGICEYYPAVGESFVMFSESLDFPGGYRVISTSPVKTIKNLDNSITIETENSTYSLIIE